MANSVDPDEMAHYEQSHLDPHCFHRYVLVCWVEKVEMGAPSGYLPAINTQV